MIGLFARDTNTMKYVSRESRKNQGEAAFRSGKPLKTVDLRLDAVN
jgi:hypothetical protein